MRTSDRPDAGRYLRAAAPLLSWMAVIFFFSSIPGSGSGADLPLHLLIERKGAHVFEYLILFFLSYDASRLAFPKLKRRGRVFLAVALSLSYAFSDEFHQRFVPAREGKLSDIGIDAVGIALGMFLVRGFLSRKRNRRQG